VAIAGFVVGAVQTAGDCFVVCTDEQLQ